MTPEKLAALAGLLPCPFCGKTAHAYNVPESTEWFVECSGCAAEITGPVQGEDSAITAWNTRALPQGYAAGVEAILKRALDACYDVYDRHPAAAQITGEYGWKAAADACCDAIRSLSFADVVVEEWVLVPKEPTMEMQEAAEISDREYTKRVFGDIATVRQGPYDTYVTMISATPPAVRGK